METLSRAACALLLVLFVSACNTPTEPTHGMSQLALGCLPDGANVRCNATAYNIGGVPSREVTKVATWLSSGASGTFVEPGLFVPSSSGAAVIWANFQGVEPEFRFTFLVSPGAPARALGFVSGNVKDATTGEKIIGATVRILDGYAAGRSAVSNSIGYYSISPVLNDETFTLEATKDGYATTRATHDGNGRPFVDITMQKN